MVEFFSDLEPTSASCQLWEDFYGQVTHCGQTKVGLEWLRGGPRDRIFIPIDHVLRRNEHLWTLWQEK